MNSSGLDEINTASRLAVLDDFATSAVAFAKQCGTARLHAAIGPVSVDFEVCGPVLGKVALDPLRHAAVEFPDAVDLSVIMIDGRATGLDGPMFDLAEMRDAPLQRGSNGVRGSTLTINDEWQTRCLIDADSRRAIVWFADAGAVPEWVVYDQIRNALHWLSHEKHFGLFHAAALRHSGIGCLITGKSGSGKSTLTAAAIAAGFDSAGDDFVLIEMDGTPRVHAVFDTLKMDPKSVAWVPRYKGAVRPSRRADDKGIVHLFDADRERIASGFPLHVILHARLTGQPPSRIVESPPAKIFRALAPSTLMLLRSQSRQVAANCAKLTERLGTYTFEIGTDVDGAVAELARFMGRIKP